MKKVKQNKKKTEKQNKDTTTAHVFSNGIARVLYANKVQTAKRKYTHGIITHTLTHSCQ